MKRTSFNDTMFRNAHRDSFLRLLFAATRENRVQSLGQRESFTAVLFAVADQSCREFPFLEISLPLDKIALIY